MSFPILHAKVEGTGIPLLILHGFLGMSDNWKSLGVQYAEAGYEVHMLDLRNHGRSFHSEIFTYTAMAQDVLAYCHANQLTRIHLIGHSMGGKVAMNLATMYPNLVEKLIVADIGPKYYPPHHQDILKGLAAVDFSQNLDRQAVEEVLKQYISIDSVRQFLMKSLFWKTHGQLAFRFNVAVFLASYDEVGAALPANQRFDQPTLFLRGGVSNYILEHDFDAIRSQFAAALFATIPNVGHWLHAENPTAFYHLTMNFFKETFI